MRTMERVIRALSMAAGSGTACRCHNARVTTAGSVAPPVEFRILGPLEVSHDGRAVTLSGARQRALLAILLLTPARSSRAIA